MSTVQSAQPIAPNEPRNSPQNSRLEFQRILRQVMEDDWEHHLTSSIKQHSLTFYRLDEMPVQQLRSLYGKLFQKQNLSQSRYEESLAPARAENIPLAGIHLASHLQAPDQLGTNQLLKLTAPFFLINQNLCQHLFKILFLPQNSQPWTEEEDLMLTQLTQKNQLQSRWSTIARQLFIMSEKRFLRCAQACRQRWQNHLDARKVRGHWTDEQDYIIVKNTLKYGKRWCIIRKKLGSARTEHMIKNRYKTILKRESRKKTIRNAQQEEILSEIEKKLAARVKLQSTQNLQCSEKSAEQDGLFDSCFKPKPTPEEGLELFQQMRNQNPEIIIALQQTSSVPDNYHSEGKVNADVSKFLSFNKGPVLPNMFEYPIFPQNTRQSPEKTERMPNPKEEKPRNSPK